MKESIEPIPVMFSYECKLGPWQLGYIHPDDLPKVDYLNANGEPAAVNLLDRDVDVYEMDNGIPAIPKFIVPLEKFKAPRWVPSWNWDTYCENRKNSK